MPLIDGQVQLRDLVMGAGTSLRFVTPFNPWQRQVRADQGGPRAWNHGSWSGAEWAAQAAIPMRLVALGVGAAGHAALMQQLLAAFAPSDDDLDLRFVVGGTEYLVRGRPRMVEPDARLLDGTGYVQAAFVALDPHIYSGTTHQQVLGLPSSVGGLTVPDPSLNANPFFESDVSNWTVTGGTFVRSTAQFHEGTTSGLLTPDGVSATVTATSEHVTGIVAGTVYRASAWVYCAVARNINLNVNWYTAADVFLSTSTSTVAVSANTWTLLDFSPTAPATAGRAALQASMGSTPLVSHLLYVDEARIRQPNTSGLTVPFTVSATVTAGRATITNAGTTDVGLTLRIDGPVSEPRVSLLSTAGTAILRLFLTLTAGQWLDIDTGARTAYLNGVASRRGLAAVNGIGWPVLPPGSHELAFDAATFDAAAQLTATWRDAWH